MRNLIISLLSCFPALCVGVSMIIFVILAYTESPYFVILGIGDAIAYIYIQEVALPTIYKEVDDLLEKLGWRP